MRYVGQLVCVFGGGFERKRGKIVNFGTHHFILYEYAAPRAKSEWKKSKKETFYYTTGELFSPPLSSMIPPVYAEQQFSKTLSFTYKKPPIKSISLSTAP